MNGMKLFWRIWLYFALVGVLLLGGCTGTPPDRLGAGDFRAELRGRLAGEGEGVEFVALLEVREVPDGREATVSYLAPATLAGCEVCVSLTDSGEPSGVALVRRSGISAEVDAATLAGLLRPVRALLAEVPQKALVREADGWRVEDADGRVIRLAPDGTPTSVCAPEISFQVVCFEPHGAQ